MGESHKGLKTQAFNYFTSEMVGLGILFLLKPSHLFRPGMQTFIHNPTVNVRQGFEWSKVGESCKGFKTQAFNYFTTEMVGLGFFPAQTFPSLQTQNANIYA